MNIDDHLRSAFKRKPAPPDFGDRLRARLEQRNVAAAAGGPLRRHLPVVRWLAVAATMALVAGGGARYYRAQRTAVEAERVKDEISVALQIAGEKLALVQRKIRESDK